MTQERKLEKVTRNSLLRLAAEAYKDRMYAERVAAANAHNSWREDYIKAKKSIMDEIGLTLAFVRFKAKWKRAIGFDIGYQVITDYEVARHSPVGEAIYDLVGEQPPFPGGDFPVVVKAYGDLRKAILTMDDFTVEKALAMIEALRTGK